MIVLGSNQLVLDIFVHSFSGHTYKVNVKVESQLWFKSDADRLLTSGVDDALWCVKVEVVGEPLGQLAKV